jgi:anaerobilin synthase
VHAGLSGHPVEKRSYPAIWKQIANTPSDSIQRSLYIHIPFCLHRCSFCPFYNSRSTQQDIETYTNYLIKELEMVAFAIHTNSAPFHAVYFGGGTPTDIPANKIDTILSLINDSFPLSNDCEITMEGRFHNLTKDKIEVYARNRVNRISLGAQTFNTCLRRKLGRIENQESMLKILEHLTSTHQFVISVDLIYGLPSQTMDDWLKDLQMVSNSPWIHSCSLYQLKKIPGTPLARKSFQDKKNKQTKIIQLADFFIASNHYLGTQNAVRISNRHWSFSNRERGIYNLNAKYGYDCLPIGCGAGGGDQYYSIMQQYHCDEYYHNLDQGNKPIMVMQKRKPNHRFHATLIGSLEEYRAIDFRKLENQRNIPDLEKTVDPLMEQWESAGMIVYKNGRMKLTDAGEFWDVELEGLLLDFIEWQFNKKGE